MRGNCEWCAHAWDRHAYPDGCEEVVGAGREIGKCPCTVTNPDHGRALDTIERLSRKVASHT